MDLSVGFAVVCGEKVFSPDADKPQGEAVNAADGLRDWLGLGYEQLEEAMALLGQSTVLHDVSESATVVDAARYFLETLLPDWEHLDFAVFPGCYYVVGDGGLTAASLLESLNTRRSRVGLDGPSTSGFARIAKNCCAFGTIAPTALKLTSTPFSAK